MEKGKFIVLEGIDGSGKSSQIGPLMKRLEGLGVPCRADREPTGGPVGSLIRQIFTGRVTADNRVIAALYAADRIDHLVNSVDGLCAAIGQGITVVSDRYYFSSYAYHSVDLDMDWVIQANAVSACLLRPTLTVFLDVPVETALERIRKNRFVEEIFLGRRGCAALGSCILRLLDGKPWATWRWWAAATARRRTPCCCPVCAPRCI